MNFLRQVYGSSVVFLGLMKTPLREFSQKSLRFFPVNRTQITVPSLRRSVFVLNGFVKPHAELFNILFPLFHFGRLSVQLNSVWSGGFAGGVTLFQSYNLVLSNSGDIFCYVHRTKMKKLSVPAKIPTIHHREDF